MPKSSGKRSVRLENSHPLTKEEWMEDLDHDQVLEEHSIVAGIFMRDGTTGQIKDAAFARKSGD